MRVIDAHTGSEVGPGFRIVEKQAFAYPEVRYLFRGTVLRIEDESLFRAYAVIRVPDGRIERVPLAVRFTHPRSFLRRVGFLLT
mgnify:FL=1